MFHFCVIISTDVFKYRHTIPLTIPRVANKQKFSALLGVFKDVKIAVAGSTRSVHPSDAYDFTKVKKVDSKDEGKDFELFKCKSSL